jgi:hypothetical protein
MMLPKAAVGAVIRSTIMEQEKLKVELEPEEDPLVDEKVADPKTERPEKIEISDKKMTSVEIVHATNGKSTSSESTHDSARELSHSEVENIVHSNQSGETLNFSKDTKPKAAMSQKLQSPVEVSIESMIKKEVDEPLKKNKLKSEFATEVQPTVPAPEAIDDVAFEGKPNDHDDRIETETNTSDGAAELSVKYTEEISEAEAVEDALSYEDTLQAIDMPETELTITPNLFKVYLKQQDTKDEMIEFDVLQENADELQLDDMLVELSSYFTQNLHEAATDSSIEVSHNESIVTQSLAEIDQIVEKQISISDNKESIIALTPELTQKLLELLRALGYKNPQEVLAFFISKHGLEFLIHAMRYLYVLSVDYTQHESLIQSTIVCVDDVGDISPQARFGRAIIALLKPMVAVPVLSFYEDV